MDTALLHTFAEVARRGSITTAAQALGYTQSAVSRQVAALEASVGAPLFERGARGVALTEYGRCLLPHAESVLARLDDALRELGALARLEAGRLRVGAFPTANAKLIPQAMAAFGDAHPSVSLSLIEGITRVQLARLRAGDIDLAVVSAFPDQGLDTEDCELVELLEDKMLIALPRWHRLARRRSIRLGELAGERWIAAAPSDDDSLLGPASLRPGSEPRIDFVVREWTAKLGLVAAGLGVTLVPSLAAEATRTDVALTSLDARDGPPRSVYVATLKRVAKPPSVDPFVAQLQRAAGTLSPTRPTPRRRRGESRSGPLRS